MRRADVRTAPSGMIDVVRHILILSVIFQHMQSESRYSPEVNALIGTMSLYIDGAVAGFFMISGYYLRIPEAFRWNEARLQAGRAFRRLIVPFLLFSAVYGVLLVALGKISMADALRSISLPQGIGPQMYFLSYLFGIQLLTRTAFSLIAPRGRIHVLALSFAAFSVGSLYLPTERSTGPAYWLLVFYQAAFLFGMLVADLERGSSGSRAVTAMLAVSLAVLGIADTSSRLFDFALVAALLCAALAVAREPWLRHRLAGSGGIYLLHTPILNHAISTALVAVGVNGVANLLAAFLATYVVALTLTLAVIRLLPSTRTLLLE